MRKIIFILTISLGMFSACNSQENKNVISLSNHCFCENDSLINDNTVSCDTTTLYNNSKLYWQFNCDRIWLTLENKNGHQFVINTVPIDLYPYTYRLGFHLIKEFDKSILFRSNCAATGPCTFTLVDKNMGNKINEFPQLILINTEDNKYIFDFIVYLSENSDYLIIYYPDSKKTLKIPFNENLTLKAYPQQQFEEMTLKDNYLKITYWTNDNTEKILNINLKDKKYSH
jgi:hypothetical protein